MLLGFYTWMRLLQLRLTGRNQQFTLMNLSVQLVALPAQSPKKFGLIGDRPFSPKTIARNGKNFISAPVELPGGPGVAIAHLPT
jgi:hypothetical protein